VPSSPPAFDDLPLIPELGIRTSWGVFGADDAVGTVNWMTQERTAKAAALISTGETIQLSLPLDLPSPQTHHRAAYRHEIFELDRNNIDDRLDGFFPQGSTQWDALRHVRAREHGFYNGAAPEELGIDKWAVRGGLVGRGVLLDVAAHARAKGAPLWPTTPTALSASLLEEVRVDQGVELGPGTVLLIRTGWMSDYLGGDQEKRAAMTSAGANLGLAGDEAMARYLWDNGVSALAADNMTIEVAPGDPAAGSLHRRLLPCLGMALGELWNLESLSARCAEQGRYDFFFVSVPLYLPGGVGSPPNAIAIW
jgi:kynurenine formamidase